MQKLNGISFQGIENKKPKLTKQNTVLNPITKELGQAALPIGDKSLAIKLTLPTEYLNESDLKRYKKVQKKWAESMAKDLGVPSENILARLPEVKIGDAKEFVTSRLFAYFDRSSNVIQMTPIREIVCLKGGDEGRVVHESLHGLLHNLRRAYAKQIPQQQLFNETYITILNKMQQGEHTQIINGVSKKEVNGVQEYAYDVMHSPTLSEKERTKLVQTILLIPKSFKDPNTNKLNDEGKDFVRKNLIPKLDEYPKTLFGNPEEVEEQVFSKIIDYINSYYARGSLLLKNLISNKRQDLEQNLNIPLSEAEKKLAKNSFGGILSTIEATYFLAKDKGGRIEQSRKAYFMSFEETLARTAHNKYRLEQINNKIEAINKKGVNPTEDLLNEKRIIENNIKLMNLADALHNIEQQIISAPKDSKKLFEIQKIIKPIKDTFANQELKPLLAYIKNMSASLLEKTPQERNSIIKNSLSSDKVKLFDNYLESFKNIPLYNELNTPDKLMSDTIENNELKSKFNNILDEIKKLSTDSDLSALPKFFYEKEIDYIKASCETSDLFKKWVKKII